MQSAWWPQPLPSQDEEPAPIGQWAQDDRPAPAGAAMEGRERSGSLGAAVQRLTGLPGMWTTTMAS